MYKKVKLVLGILFLSFSIFLTPQVVNAQDASDEDTALLSLGNIIKELGMDVEHLGTRAPIPGYEGWLIMVYMDGDNNLESAAIDDFLEMAEVDLGDSINVVVQMDRISGYDSSYDDWTGCARFLIDQGDTPVLENADYDWGESQPEMEKDMGDSQTLVDFVQWAVSNHDAPNRALILWNHGGGWRDRVEELEARLKAGGSALSLQERNNILDEINRLERKIEEEKDEVVKAVCWDDTDGGVLYTKEVGEALNYLYMGEINLNLIGFDACLMGMIEVAHELCDKGADVMVASEANEPNDGWPYNLFLSDLASDPTMDSYSLGEAIVTRYGQSYGGANTLSAVGIGGGGYVEAKRAQAPPGSVLDLSNAVSNFASTVIEEDTDWDVIFYAKQMAGYYSYSCYRDLRGFMEGVVANATNAAIKAAAQGVITAFDNCRIANHTSLAYKGNGLSIYFTDWIEYVDEDYNATNISFAGDTQWDEFLEAYTSASLAPSGYTGTDVYSRTVPAKRYVMVSSPLVPDNPDPEANLKDDLGSYDKKVWRLFRWNSIHRTYGEYPFPGDNVELGKAYWLISHDAKRIDIKGTLATTEIPYVIVLYPGWNQVGCPFDFDIDWDTVLVTDGYTDVYYASSLNPFISSTLWKYVSGAYGASAIMEPGSGYWVKNITNSYVYLVVVPAPSSLSRDNIDLLEAILTKVADSKDIPPAPPIGIGDGIAESPSSDGGSGSSSCFVATASFGSSMAGEVNILRVFRDRYLLENPLGRKFVSLYYKYSPPVAEFIAEHNSLRKLVRASLYPVVKGCKLAIEDYRVN